MAGEWWQIAGGAVIAAIGLLNLVVKGRNSLESQQLKDLIKWRQELAERVDLEATARQALEAKYFELRERFVGVMEQLSSVRQENTRLSDQVSTISREKSDLETRVRHLEEQLQTRDRELAAVQGERDALKREVTGYTEREILLRDQVLQLEAKVASLRGETAVGG